MAAAPRPERLYLHERKNERTSCEITAGSNYLGQLLLTLTARTN